MKTPAEHAQAATALMDRHATDQDARITGRMHAHAALAQAAGTGTSYEHADTLLEQVADRMASPVDPKAVTLMQLAFAHALMADR